MKQRFMRGMVCLMALTLCLTTGCQNGANSTDPSDTSDASDTAQESTTVMPDYSIGLTADGLYDGYTALDYVTLPEGYDSIPSSEEFTTVSEEALQEAIDQFMSAFASDTQILDRAVEDGDMVNLDYVGYIDGVAFEGGDSQGAGLDYTAGSDDLIDDFLTQIIGAMPGDTLDVTVTFPDPYTPNEELSGKEAVFQTTINYIHGEAQAPELTEEFVANYLSYYYGYSSVADLREQFTAELLGEQQYNYVLDWLYANSEFTVPDKLVEDQVSLLQVELENAANTYEITLDELAAQYGMDDLEALLDAYRPALENMVKQNLMCQAVAEAAGITVDEQAVSDYFRDVVGVSDYSSYVDSYGQGYIYQGVRTELAAQYLIDHVV